MSLLGAVKNAVQSTVKQVEQKVTQTAAQVKEQAPSAPARARDAFTQLPRPQVQLRGDCMGASGSLELKGVKLAAFKVGVAGVRVSDFNSSIGNDQKGLGGSTHILGREVGLHLKAVDGQATLGAVDLEMAGEEYVMGMVPQAPSPIPMLVYAGKDRDGEG